jgi:hypothetical protein
MNFRPTTIAGLAVQAQAIKMVTCNFTDIGEGAERSFIESACALCGVLPLAEDASMMDLGNEA